jgi:hypothetical protein
MTLLPSATHYALSRASIDSWSVTDTRRQPSDPRHSVAMAHENEDGTIDVVWLRATPLPTSFLTLEALMLELDRWARQPGETRKPDPIPHKPPISVYRADFAR